MSTQDEQRQSYEFLTSITVEDVEALRSVRPNTTVEIVVRDADIPCDFSFGYFHFQAPSGCVLEALAEDLSQIIGNLETRISEKGGSTLPLVGFWSPLLGAGMAFESVVRDRGERG